MGASILDVSAETSTAVQTGDTLTIQLFTWNYKVNAARQNQPLYPTDVTFDLVSAPLIGNVGFDATLESADGKASFALGGLTFVPGDLQSSGYTDDVSVLEGHRHLSLADSEALFSGPSIVIILRNEGPGFTLGLAPYLLRQDVFASLSGGTVSVGAIPDSVELESQDPEQAREYLLQYLPEHSETQETPIQKVMHRFKF